MKKKPASKFVSLHNHTSIGSPLDSMNSVDGLMERSAAIDQHSIAVTDHGTMTAIYDARNASKAAGVKLIPGIEAYFTTDLSLKRNNHLVLLAKNEKGYRNLLRLNYEGYKNQSAGYMGKYTPRLTWEHIEEFNEGIIALTACSSGLIARTLITEENEELAKCHIKRMQSIFKEDFFLELQPHNLVATSKSGEINQQKLNQALIRLSHDMKIPYVITCDAHYKDAEHAKYHDFMLAIKDKKSVNDPNRFRYGVQDMYLKTHEEITDFFGEKIASVGMANTVRIEAMCEDPHYIDPKGPILPKFPVKDQNDYPKFKKWHAKSCPGVEEDKSYLRYLCVNGFKERFKDRDMKVQKEYWARVKKELSVLEDKDFSSYMLIVADYTRWAKSQGMPVGLARGCLIGETPVIMEDSVKKLMDIEVGDSVYTHTGNLKRVSDIMSYDIKEELLSIRTSLDDEIGITLTRDHKVFGQKGIRVSGFDKLTDELKRKSSRTLWKPPIGAVCEIKAEDLSVGDWIHYPYLNRTDLKVPTWHADGSTINTDIELDEDLSWLIGLWIAGGCFATDVEEWRVQVPLSDASGTDRLLRVLSSVGVRESDIDIELYGNCHTIVTKEKSFVSWWKKVLPKWKSLTKYPELPDFAFKLPEAFLNSMIYGYLGRRQVISGTPRALAEHIKFALLILKSPCSISKTEILEDSSIEQGYTLIVPQPLSGWQTTGCQKVEEGFFCQIKKISTTSEHKKVYDITVEDDHSYLTTSGAVHNSAAGSLVAYLSGITGIDPMKYGLIFERFHNSEKTTFPDIDSDFSKPGMVKSYIKQKYGEANVASISNWSTLSPKVVIKDTARSLELGGDKSTAFRIANHITSIMPDSKTIEEACLLSPEFAGYMKKYPTLYEYACQLQGLVRNWSVHAAGVILSDRPLYETVPLRIDPKSGLVVAQWEKTRCEENGYVKMDVLGLNNLTVMDEAFKLIKTRHGKVITMENIPIEDKETFDMIGRGETGGVFQLEASLTPLCVKIKPQSISEISDINAMGRPSCSAEQRKHYIRRKMGLEPVTYRHERLTNSLEKTYGVSLYEEGMMTIVKDCAGWDLNQADALRKITKLKGKDPGLVKRTKDSFISDCVKVSKMSRKKAAEIWTSEIEIFSNYGFNFCLLESEMVTVRPPGSSEWAPLELRNVKPGSMVRSRDESTGEAIEVEVIARHNTGELKLYEVELDDGRVVRCSIDHKFRTDSGEMLPLHQILRENLDIVVSPEEDLMAIIDTSIIIEKKLSMKRTASIMPMQNNEMVLPSIEEMEVIFAAMDFEDNYAPIAGN